MSWLVAGLTILTSAAAQALPEDAARERPPNVLLLVADDQGYADLGCAGLADDVETPHLDRLAAGGARFTQAYATSPICSPSRAGLLTGSYHQRFGVWWYGGPGLDRANVPTIAERLKEAGYSTGYVGKWHYGRHDQRVEQRSFPLQHGFDEVFGFAGGRKHYLVHTAAAEDAFRAARRDHERRGQSLRMGPFWVGGGSSDLPGAVAGEPPAPRRVDQEGFSTELLGERARAFLAAHRDEPFFLQVGFNAVHNFTHQLPEAYLAEHGLDPYPDWDPAAEPYRAWYERGRAPNNPDGRAHFLGQLHYLDREVGGLLDALDELGLSEDTLVVYVGDNGGSTPIYADNSPLRGGKYTLYEGGIRVPLLVRWPGRVRSGSVYANVVSAMDLLPTICAAAGVELEPAVDGIDLGPLLRGESSELGHETLVWDTRHERAVRHGDWKLRVAESRRHADSEMTELELGSFLYDLAADPGERTNLAAAHPDVVAALEALHARWRAEVERDE